MTWGKYQPGGNKGMEARRISSDRYVRARSPAHSSHIEVPIIPARDE